MHTNIPSDELDAFASGAQKFLTLTFDDGTVIDNNSIKSESMEIVESICDDNTLSFGTVTSNQFKVYIKASNVRFKGKRFLATITVVDEYGNNYQENLGYFTVKSDDKTSDKIYRQIVAYDDINRISQLDVSGWYERLSFPMTLKNFRDSFFNYVGITQKSVNLPNDSIQIEKTISTQESDDSTLTQALIGLDVLKSICELNGCFGNIDRNGVFEYIFLNSSFDKSEKIDRNRYTQNSLDYSDFVTKKIEQVQIRESDNDLGGFYPTTKINDVNLYVIQGNFLVYGKSESELQSIAQTIYSKVKDISYQPVKSILTRFNPSMELGDTVTTYSYLNGSLLDTINFYILKRTTKGITALYESYSANGTETYAEKINGLTTDYKQLKGKSNIFERTLERTLSKITEIDENVVKKSEFEQTVDGITAKVESIESEIDGSINVYYTDEEPTLLNYPAWDFTLNIPCNNTVQTTEDLHFEYKPEYYRKFLRTIVYDENGGQTYRFAYDQETDSFYWQPATDTEFGVVMERVSKLEVKADHISGEVSEVKTTVDAQGKQIEDNHSLIEQTAKDILLEVSSDYQTKDAMSDYSTTVQMNSAIKIASDNISSTVSKTYQTKDAMGNYSTTAQVESKIDQKADSITSTVAQYTDDWDTRKFSISIYGFNAPDSKEYPPRSYIGKYYLDRTNGKVYVGADNYWKYLTTLEKSATSLSSEIKQNAINISLKVSKDSVISEINQSAEKISIKAEKIDLKGYVTVESLKDGGTTTIDGSRITSGTIFGRTIDGGKITQDFYDPTSGDISTVKIEGGILYYNNVKLTDFFRGGFYFFGLDVGVLSATTIVATDITAQAYHSSSDKRLKKDIVDLDDRLVSLIDAVEPKQYRFKKGDEYLKLGFIAQEMDDALDKIGIEDKPIIVEPESEDDFYALDYNDLIAVLWKDAQNQHKKNIELETELNQVKTELAELKALVNSLVEREV